MAIPTQTLSLSTYLTRDRQSRTKSEYLDG